MHRHKHAHTPSFLHLLALVLDKKQGLCVGIIKKSQCLVGACRVGRAAGFCAVLSLPSCPPSSPLLARLPVLCPPVLHPPAQLFSKPLLGTCSVSYSVGQWGHQRNCSKPLPSRVQNMLLLSLSTGRVWTHLCGFETVLTPRYPTCISESLHQAPAPS